MRAEQVRETLISGGVKRGRRYRVSQCEVLCMYYCDLGLVAGTVVQWLVPSAGHHGNDNELEKFCKAEALIIMADMQTIPHR